MRALMILGVVLAVLLGLSLVRIGAIAEYGAQGLSVRLRLGPVRIRVFPFPPPKAEKKKKRPPKASKAPQEPPPEQSRAGGALALVKELLPVAADAAGALKRKICIDRIALDFTAAAADPAAAAMAFGGGNALIGMIWPVLEHNFTVKERRIRTAVAFGQTSPTVYVWASLSMTIGQAVAFAAGLCVRVLRILMAHRARNKAARGDGTKSTIS